ncbi:MAG TPA: carboxypeptidase regulatory-like domain-containing protein [Myxococcales bacterium]|nr:carboxypeptidase regulatory-like domain-containing protein [Myxococcales bacterium]
MRPAAHLLPSAARWLLLAAATLATAAFAVGETTGRIRGYVYDDQGHPVGDLELRLKSTKLLRPAVLKTHKDGSFEFDGLPPGEDYDLAAEGAGYASLRQKNIRVRLGQTTPVDLLLAEASETMVVTGKPIEKANPVINPDTAQTGAVVTAEKAASTPIFNQVEGMTQLAPGVGPGTRPSTRGGLSRYTKFYIDGMDTSDISDGSITAPMNFYAVENFEVISGGQDAQYNSMGAVENIVTKTGGNDLSYDFQFVASPDWLNATARSGGNAPAPFGPFTEPTDIKPVLTSFFAPHLNIGGPIIKDRVWFFSSAQMNLSGRNNLITYRDGSTEVRPNDTTTLLARFKLTWQPTDADKLSFALNLDHNTIENQIGSNAVTRDAETRIDRGGYFFIINYDHNFTPDLTFNLQTGTTSKNVNNEPSSGTEAASHRDSTQSLTYFQAGPLRTQAGPTIAGNFLREFKQRYTFDPALRWRVGGHELKGGLQISYMQSLNTTGVLGTFRYADRNGICNEADSATFPFCVSRATFWDTDSTQDLLTTKGWNLNTGGFVSDRWNVNRNLTLIPGFRIDVGQLNGQAGRLANLVGYGPRMSITYDVFGDRKTLFTAYYGRSNDVGDVFLSQRGNPDLYQVTANWDAAAKAFPDCSPTNVLPGCTVTGGPNGKLFRQGSTPPHVDEVVAGLHQEIFEDTAMGVDLSYRRYSNLWVEREVNRIWDVTGTRIVGHVDPTVDSVIEIDNPADAYREYRGADFWVEGRPGNWDVLASYTLSFTSGTVDDYFDGYLNNPRQAMFWTGPSTVDTRHTFKGAIGYKTSIGLDFSLRWQYRTGTPLWESFLNPFDQTQTYRRSARGSGFAFTGSTADFNNPDQLAELRNPDFWQVDAQARYDLGSLLRLREKVELTLLLINVLNSTAPTAYNDAWLATGTNTFGAIRSRLSPLQAELLLRFHSN